MTERDGRLTPPLYRIEFYEEKDGRMPVLEWIRYGMSPMGRRALGRAMRRILQEFGVAVCGTSFGKQLGDGLFEFRLRESHLLFRVFCHPHGDRVIVLLGGYDKGRDPSARRQAAEIATARRRLHAWRAGRRMG